MKLFIAEKPSLGRAIADALPGNKISHGSPYPTHIEMSNGDVVSWARGHLLQQAEPHEYNGKWKSWDIKTLPIVVSEWKMNPVSSGKAQLNVLKDLMDQADIIVNAGDPDREGQLIVDEIIEYFNQTKKSQQRLWLNAVDLTSTRKALAGMEDNKAKKFKDLQQEALCRQRADWLVGMNMTRAVTKALAPDNTLASVGRVQTPTLALVVNRCNEIENFKPKDFYELELDVVSGKDRVKLTFSTTDFEKRLWDKKAAEALAAKLKNRSVTVNAVSTEKTANPPPLFHLPDFQKFAGKNLKWGVAKSLKVLQELYEAKLTTYPRTESNKLPPEQEPDGVPIGKGLLTTGKFDLAKSLPMATRAHVYTCSKDDAHHAVVPTQIVPKSFSDKDMETAWTIVANRFLMSLLPAYKFTETVISVKEEGLQFTIKGEVALVNPTKTWLVLSSEQRKSVSLPGIPNGANGVIQDVKVISKSTSSPDYYTEATLLEDMRSVAKFVTNDKLKSILKETSGIGTAATQASIIELIKSRGLIVKEGEKLKDSPFGRSLIQNLPSQLKDPGLTAAWEDALAGIGKGTYPVDGFMKRIEEFVSNRLTEVIALKGNVVLSAEKTRKGAAPAKAKTKKTTGSGTGGTTTRAQQQKPSKPLSSPRTGGIAEF